MLRIFNDFEKEAEDQCLCRWRAVSRTSTRKKNKKGKMYWVVWYKIPNYLGIMQELKKGEEVTVYFRDEDTRASMIREFETFLPEGILEKELSCDTSYPETGSVLYAAKLRYKNQL